MFISDREPTTDQSTNTTQAQLGEFYWGYLYEYGRGVMHRGRKAVSPKPTPAWVTAHKAGDLEHSAQTAGSSAGGGSPSDDSVGLNFQA